MTGIKNTLTKKERLYGTKRIDELFASGKSFIAYPLRIVYIQRETNENLPQASIMVSVSKKKFKRAVKRNRVKRLIREAFRLNKIDFIQIAEQYSTGIDIAFLYLKNELPDYHEIEQAVRKAGQILKEKLESKENENNK